MFGPQQTKNPYTGEVTRVGELYWGARTAKPIVDAVVAQMTDQHVSHIKTAAELEEFKGAGEAAKVRASVVCACGGRGVRRGEMGSRAGQAWRMGGVDQSS